MLGTEKAPDVFMHDEMMEEAPAVLNRHDDVPRNADGEIQRDPDPHRAAAIRMGPFRHERKCPGRQQRHDQPERAFREHGEAAEDKMQDDPSGPVLLIIHSEPVEEERATDEEGQ